MPPLRIWYWAARPKTLWAAVAPVMIGTAMAYADGGFHAISALAALAGALLIQIGTNFCNDYADFCKGADTEERIGPLRVTQAGLVSPDAMRRATFVTFMLAALVGTYLVYRGGWWMFAIASLSIVAGIAYTAGRYALAYLGLGDLFVLLFFGPIAVGGTYYVQALSWPPLLWYAGLAPGLLSCAILSVNNLRDREEDRKAGKRTLAVRFGPLFARAEYIGCVVVAVLIIPLICWRMAERPHALMLLPMAVIVLAVKPMTQVLRGPFGAALNPVLGQTARLLLCYALLFTIGWIGASVWL